MGATPNLLSPADSITARLGSQIFSWQPIDGGADRYVLQLAKDAGFTQLVSELETTFTQVEQQFVNGTLYYWRVQAHVGGSTFTSATARSFSAPPFVPASQADHVAAGKARLLNQFREDA